MTGSGSLLAASGLVLPHIQYSAIAPELIMIGGAIALLGISALVGKALPRVVFMIVTGAVSLAALGQSLSLWTQVTGAHHHGYAAVDGAIAVDGFSILILVLVSCATFLVALGAKSFLAREHMDGPEFYVLMMLSASGAMLMGAADDLIVIFLGLEILSIALYVLAGSNLRRSVSGEAALKYFLLGGFSSAIFLYGIALVYGATGSTNFPQIAAFLSKNLISHNGVLLAGLALLLVGFAFKIAAVPFHFWAPDVYQGSPTPATAFMAAVAKAGGFAGLLRVAYSTFPTLRLDWQPIIWVLAILSLVVGSVLALAQRDVKRMLAYSSISHAGFVLIGLQAASARGIAGSLYYLFAYTFLVIGSFTVVAVVGGKGDAAHDLESYRGLASRAPFLAGAMALFLVAQAGVPFTTGFLAKFYVIAAAAASHSYAIALIGMLSAVIAAFFYLRVVVYMYGSGPFALEKSAVKGDDYMRVGGSGDQGELGGTAVTAGSSGSASLAIALAPSQVSAIDSEAGEFHDDLSDPVMATMGDDGPPTGRITVDRGAAVVIVLAAAVTVAFGIFPSPLIDFARHATLLF